MAVQTWGVEVAVLAVLAAGLVGRDARADCSVDADCKGGRVCAAGSCVARCKVDKDCSGDETCSSRACVSYALHGAGSRLRGRGDPSSRA
jgi:hypothetical protein